MVLIFIQLYCSLFLLGLIWTIQIVHYPSFKFVAKESFQDFSSFHSNRISFIVIPIMSIELITAFLLAFSSYHILTAINLVLVLLIWMSTFCLSVPLHMKLLNGKDQEIIRKLVLTNWPRTILWSIKVGLNLWMISNF